MCRLAYGGPTPEANEIHTSCSRTSQDRRLCAPRTVRFQTFKSSQGHISLQFLFCFILKQVIGTPRVMETTRDENFDDHSSDHSLAKMSLSSRTIHADDYLNKNSDVAPPMHLSTTFRYNQDPKTLKTWKERTVRSSPSSKPVNQLTNIKDTSRRVSAGRPHLLPLYRAKYHSL